MSVAVVANAEAIRRHYDSFALLYRAFWGDHIHHGLFRRGDESGQLAQVQMLEHCARLAGVKRGWRVLDVGCGHGGTCIFLADRYHCRTHGITLSETQARLARHNAAAEAGIAGMAEFVVADADLHLFPPETYDLVWTMESSEHFLRKAAYFQNVRKTLRPGGIALVAAWTGDMRHSRVRDVAQYFICAELQTAAEYARQLERAGLQIQAQENLTQYVIKTWEICRRRAEAAKPLLKFLSSEQREFVQGIEIILDAYRSGDLSYSVLVAKKIS